jgi:excisionase family DNA binding protein
MYLTPAEIADRFRISRDTVYALIRRGVIPAGCIDRIGSTIRIRRDKFEETLQRGALFRPRRVFAAEPIVAEDSVTFCRRGNETEHRWAHESGNVMSTHPYGSGRDDS